MQNKKGNNDDLHPKIKRNKYSFFYYFLFLCWDEKVTEEYLGVSRAYVGIKVSNTGPGINKLNKIAFFIYLLVITTFCPVFFFCQ